MESLTGIEPVYVWPQIQFAVINPGQYGGAEENRTLLTVLAKHRRLPWNMRPRIFGSVTGD